MRFFLNPLTNPAQHPEPNMDIVPDEIACGYYPGDFQV
jgi:hypothetical protein